MITQLVGWNPASTDSKVQARPTKDPERTGIVSNQARSIQKQVHML